MRASWRSVSCKFLNGLLISTGVIWFKMLNLRRSDITTRYIQFSSGTLLKRGCTCAHRNTAYRCKTYEALRSRYVTWDKHQKLCRGIRNDEHHEWERTGWTMQHTGFTGKSDGIKSWYEKEQTRSDKRETSLYYQIIPLLMQNSRKTWENALISSFSEAWLNSPFFFSFMSLPLSRIILLDFLSIYDSR